MVVVGLCRMFISAIELGFFNRASKMKCRITGERVDHCAGDCARCDAEHATFEHRARVARANERGDDDERRTTNHRRVVTSV